ncbi:hypothetical protein OKW43_006539 [Paraburkholderia sp. WC7.3g]
MNKGSGPVLGNPTDLTQPVGFPFALDPTQNPRTFQSYSHYVMPGGSLAPTVKINRTGCGTAFFALAYE